MAFISCFLLLSAVSLAAHALDTPATVRASYIEGDRSVCSDGLHCYSSLLQHNAVGLHASRGSAADRRWETPQLHKLKDLAVYVYELPEHMTLNGSSIDLRDLKCPWEFLAGSDFPSESCLFGDVFEMSSPGGGEGKLELRDVQNFALGRIFYASLLMHPRRTSNPREADLFFIPVFNTKTHPDESRCPTAEQLVGQLPHLTEETAARHFWLTATTAWTTRTCAVFNAQLDSASPAVRLLARTQKMALEDRASAPRTPEMLRDIALGAGDGSEPGRGPPTAENLHSIPYPAVTSGLNDASVQAWMEYTTAPREREYLVSAIWGVHGMGSTVDIRTELGRQCEQSPACSFTDLGKFVPHESYTLEVHALKFKSTFCMEPTGDTPSRKGMVDSIVAGCIPVLFSPLQTHLWPWHVGKWEDVSILMANASEEVDVIGLLSQVPEAEVTRLRGNMARLVPRLTFALPGQPRPGDALETALAGVWRASM